MKHLLKVLMLSGLLILQCGQAFAADASVPDAVPAPAPAPNTEISAERRADIEKLLAMTNALAMGKQMSAAMVNMLGPMLKNLHPNIPDKVLDALPGVTNEVIAEQLPAFQEAMIALYAQYYSADDIKALIGFYGSDIGQKTIKLMPALMQESMAKGAAWGRGLAPEIRRRLKDRFKKENIDI